MRLVKLLFGLSLMLFLYINSSGQQMLSRQFVYKGTTVGYMVYLPDDYNSNSYVYPTIIFHHGVGEMGNGTTDLQKVTINGLPNLIQNGTFPKSFLVAGKTYKFIVICPQLNGDVPWQNWMDMESSLVQHFKATYRIDNSRLYLTGLSQGGGFAWQYAGYSKSNADQFAALAPVCGAMDPNWGYPENIAASKLPVWAFHGENDNVVSPELSKTWIQKINAAAGSQIAKLTLYPNTDHGSWGKAYDLLFNQKNGYSNVNVYEWLLSNQRGATPANAQYNIQQSANVVTPPPVVTPPAIVQPVEKAPETTANIAVKSYNSDYMYGVNMGYYGSNWEDTQLATLIKEAGGNTVRPSLPQSFLNKWGYEIRVNAFKDYAERLQMKEITAFVGQPAEDVRDKTKFGGCDAESKVFANLYEPIWNSDGSVNSKNYYADYIYKTVKNYGQYVRFWEVWNEPDFTYADPAAWMNRDPYPCELTNLNAPVQSYIRMLRITYEIVKKYNPDSYVTTGGFGYTSFLDAVLRNTDNPDGGKVSAAYPNKGGAYFDVLSYHCYPSYYLRSWNTSINNFSYNRNSDAAANQVGIEKTKYEETLKKYGYGSTFPGKLFIVSEANVSRKTFDWYSASDEMQKNFGMKMLVQAQKNDIKQLYFYSIGETTDAASARSGFDLMGMYENLNTAKAGTEKINQAGVGHKTLARLIFGSRFDASLTAQLNMGSDVDGAVFTSGTNKYYVLWAKTKSDQSETAAASYTFPDALKVKTLKQYGWDYATSNKITEVSGAKVALNGSPVVFTISATQDAITPPPTTPTPPVVTTPPVTTPVVTVPPVTTPVVTTPVVTTPPVTKPEEIKEVAKIFPNPVNTEANFTISNQETGKGTISIYNMRGLKVQEIAFTKSDMTKNMSVPAATLRTGMYIVVIRVNAKTNVLKLMKI